MAVEADSVVVVVVAVGEASVAVEVAEEVDLVGTEEVVVEEDLVEEVVIEEVVEEEEVEEVVVEEVEVALVLNNNKLRSNLMKDSKVYISFEVKMICLQPRIQLQGKVYMVKNVSV